MEKTRKLSTSLTDSRFGGWGWSMIIYSLLMYLFMSAISCDLQNLIPEAFAGVYGMDPNALLAYATPTSIVGIVGGFFFGRLLIKYSTKKISGIGCILVFCLLFLHIVRHLLCILSCLRQLCSFAHPCSFQHRR